jgi:hypothetical protein
MSNALVLVEDEWLSNVFAINLALYAGLDSIIKHDTSHLKGLEELGDVFDLIIMEEWINDQNSFKEFVEIFGLDRIKSLPIIVIKPDARDDGDRFSNHLNCTLLENISVADLLKATARSLDITASDMFNRPVPSKFPIDLKYFEVFRKSPFQIFKKHRLDGKEAVYQLEFEKDDEVNNDKIDSLRKGLNRKLFIMSSERLKFANAYTIAAFEKYSSNNYAEAKKKFLELSRESIFSHINDGGSIEEIADLADKCIVETLEEIDEHKNCDFTEYIEKLLESGDSYFLQHTLITTYISFSIIEKLSWNSLSQKKTFTSAAFFQNILFSISQEDIAKIRSDDFSTENVENDTLTEDEMEIIRNHALETSSLMSDTEISFFPENTHTIVRQRHGNRKGIGFVRDPERALHPMSIIFMLANDYADTVLIDEITDHEEILKTLTKKYLNSTKYNQYLVMLKVGTVEAVA